MSSIEFICVSKTDIKTINMAVNIKKIVLIKNTLFIELIMVVKSNVMIFFKVPHPDKVVNIIEGLIGQKNHDV